MTADSLSASVLLIANPFQLPSSQRVWGTGGWQPPEMREALDWLCLVRGLGWGVKLAFPDAASIARGLSAELRWIIVACDPDELTGDFVKLLREALVATPALLLGRVAARASEWSALGGVWKTGNLIRGRSLSWNGDCAQQWQARNELSGMSVSCDAGGEVLACLDQLPIVVARRQGRGTVLTLGFHPSEIRDADGCGTALLRKCLICASLQPVAWFDLSNTMALRMDDPGAAQSVYLSSWSYRQLGRQEWGQVMDILDTHLATLSVAYVGGWVDDGDPKRGNLRVGGNDVERVAGQIHPSAEVVYEDIAGQFPGTIHDYAGQYDSLRKGQDLGLIDIELHGYTHMNPDLRAWSVAPDRYSSVHWFRELGAYGDRLAGRPVEHPVFKGMSEIERRFGVKPSTLICPGDEWSQIALELALDGGVQSISSYYYAFRFGGRFCWSQHLCAPYLDEPDSSWLDSGLPVVGYFHDAEISQKGSQWLESCLSEWQHLGMQRFVSLRVLSEIYSGRLVLDAREEGWVLLFDSVPRKFSDCRIPISIFSPDRGIFDLSCSA
jgi:hypothetical protein